MVYSRQSLEISGKISGWNNEVLGIGYLQGRAFEQAVSVPNSARGQGGILSPPVRPWQGLEGEPVNKITEVLVASVSSTLFH